MLSRTLLTNLRNYFRENAPAPGDLQEQSNIEIRGRGGGSWTESPHECEHAAGSVFNHHVVFTCEIISVTSIGVYGIGVEDHSELDCQKAVWNPNAFNSQFM